MASATLSLADEGNASFVVLPIESESFPLDLPLGGDIDKVGAASTMPCAAVRTAASRWNRIVVITGDHSSASDNGDSLALVAEVVARLRQEHEVPVLLFALEPSDVNLSVLFPGTTPTGYAGGSGDVLEHIVAGDLLVVPSSVVEAAGVVARTRLQQVLRDTSVAVIGCPGGLRVSMQRTHRPLLGMMGTPREA